LASCSHLCASVTKQYNLVPAKRRWCSASGKVTADLAEINGSLPPSGWLKSPAGWLPVHWDQLRTQRSVTSMGSLYLFTVAKRLNKSSWFGNRRYNRRRPLVVGGDQPRERKTGVENCTDLYVAVSNVQFWIQVCFSATVRHTSSCWAFITRSYIQGMIQHTSQIQTANVWRKLQFGEVIFQFELWESSQRPEHSHSTQPLSRGQRGRVYGTRKDKSSNIYCETSPIYPRYELFLVG